MTTYIGFSTYNRAKKFKLTDFELVRQDLFNHFNIRRGEKLMNPNFGTIIWDMLYEPYTDATRTAITEDIKSIVSYDPRIRTEDIVLTNFTNGILIEVSLRYLPTNEVAAMTLKFDNERRQLLAG